MSVKKRITEYLDVDVESEVWSCHCCGRELVSAHRNYKEGCLVYERDPLTVYRPVVQGEFTLAPDPEWCRIIEFYCPGCGIKIESEFLPPGHPITHDIELDLARLKANRSGGQS